MHRIFVINVVPNGIPTVSAVVSGTMIVLSLLITNSFGRSCTLFMRHLSSLLDMEIVVMLGFEGTCVALQLISMCNSGRCSQDDTQQDVHMDWYMFS